MAVRVKSSSVKRSSSGTGLRPVASDDNIDLMTTAQRDLLSQTSENVCDNCCFLVICPTHQRLLLRRSNIFFPFLPIDSTKTWFDSALEGAIFLLANDHEITKSKLKAMKIDVPFRKLVCMHILRFQLPSTQRFITRLIYLVELDPKNKNVTCCINTKAFRWRKVSEAIPSKIAQVWGPEVSYFTNIACSSEPLVSTIVEYSLNDAFKYLPRDVPNSPEEHLLIGTNITVNDIERLYADFIEHCFPSFFFTRHSFLMYMQKHQIETDARIISRYYSAFRMRGKQYMQFHELLIGLVSIDLRAPHEELRFKLLFRFYDMNKDEYLNFNEFKLLYQDTLDVKMAEKITDQEIKNVMKKIGIIKSQYGEMIDFNGFKRGILKGYIKGTAKLCRSAVNPFGQITRSLATRKLCSTVSSIKLGKICLNRNYKGRCQTCKAKSYEISTNLVILDSKGFLIGSKRLFENVTRTSPPLKPPLQPDGGADKLALINFFWTELHKFNKNKDAQKLSKGIFYHLSKTEMQAFSDDLRTLCIDVCKILESENRVLRIDDPAYVIGDIHGNLEDLISLENCLWRTFPIMTANFVFLGDYVDRGKWGFECFLYLMIAKYLAPKRIFMLRGNHEIRVIQTKYSFQKELTKKYGNSMGQLFFDCLNEVMDRLPVCAVVGDSIYLAHGGIPYSEQNLQKLNNSTPYVITEPETEAKPVWELLWSDPLEYSRFGETAQLLGLPANTFNGMFLPNVKRGTSFFFNEYGVLDFFKENNLNYMIRAHEVPAPGFKFNFGTMCLTVFSCSHYCGADNEAAVVFIDRDSRIRIIRIDTSMNAPAT